MVHVLAGAMQAIPYLIEHAGAAVDCKIVMVQHLCLMCVFVAMYTLSIIYVSSVMLLLIYGIMIVRCHYIILHVNIAIPASLYGILHNKLVA